jgi:hypothetical protein
MADEVFEILTYGIVTAEATHPTNLTHEEMIHLGLVESDK